MQKPTIVETFFLSSGYYNNFTMHQFLTSNFCLFNFQGIRTLPKNGTLSKRSPNDSAASSPDITTRAILNRSLSSNNNNNNNQCNPHNNNNNNANGNNGVAMSETSDDSSLNSVDLDPMGKRTIL